MFPELLRDLGIPTQSLLESHWSSVNGRKLHSRKSKTVTDEGIPFVLIHGLVISGLYMIPLAECISREHDVYALDLPGFGRSEGPSEVFSVSQLADWVIAWMSVTGIHQCHLVGNSLGCEIAAHVAVKAPQNVVTLSLSTAERRAVD